MLDYTSNKISTLASLVRIGVHQGDHGPVWSKGFSASVAHPHPKIYRIPVAPPPVFLRDISLQNSAYVYKCDKPFQKKYQIILKLKLCKRSPSLGIVEPI